MLLNGRLKASKGSKQRGWSRYTSHLPARIGKRIYVLHLPSERGNQCANLAAFTASLATLFSYLLIQIWQPCPPILIVTSGCAGVGTYHAWDTTSDVGSFLRLFVCLLSSLYFCLGKLVNAVTRTHMLPHTESTWSPLRHAQGNDAHMLTRSHEQTCKVTHKHMHEQTTADKRLYTHRQHTANTHRQHTKALLDRWHLPGCQNTALRPGFP